MKTKKIITFCMAVIMLFSFAIPTFALNNGERTKINPSKICIRNSDTPLTGADNTPRQKFVITAEVINFGEKRTLPDKEN